MPTTKTELRSPTPPTTSSGAADTPSRPRSRRLNTAVVLAGVAGRLATVRSALGRNLFELPRSTQASVFESWLARFQAAIASDRDAPFNIHLALDQEAPAPRPVSLTGVTLTVSRDPETTRGTAGVLRDLTIDLDEHEQVLVISASDLAWEWTADEIHALFDPPADVVISADRELRPCGPISIRCGLLKRVASVGFIDLKEQFLPRCVGCASIHVARSDRVQTGSLHDLRSYLVLLGGDESNCGSPWSSERWDSKCSVVEPGARVAPDAVIFDSVVLNGATVERDAVLVRSVIGPGAVVRSGNEVVDKVLVGPGPLREVIW